MNAVCPYCGVDAKSYAFRYCSACGTAHHEECWEDNGGCTVFGCSSGPPDEPKLNVDVGGIAARTAFSPEPPPLPVVAPPPPPPSRSHPLPQGGYAPDARTDNAPQAPRPLPSFGGYYVPPPQYAVSPGYYAAPPKSRTAFIVLGIFLGAFGGHNFFAGYTGKAIAQLCITLCSVFTLSIVSAIWAIVEICTVDRDSNGIPMI